LTLDRLIVDPPLPGAWNMAVDEALFVDAIDNGVATLRLYRWNEPTLSLGYFQKYDDRGLHPASQKCAVVRRQTGGGAILHDREITYSVVLPSNHEFARGSEALYNVVHDVFIDVLTDQISDHETIELRRNKVSNSSAGLEPFLCFQRRAIGDVVATPSREHGTTSRGFPLPKSGGWKVLGSAQRRSRGVLLQHGSLLLKTSPAAPELPGLADVTAWEFSEKHVEPLVQRLENGLNLRFRRTELPSKLQLIAEELANKKYGSITWTKRR
jgi:lipoyl(octanoyl) transferase